MGNSLRDLGISDDELTREIKSSAAVRAEKVKRAKEMQSTARSIAPKETGNYAAKIQVVTTKTGKIRLGALAWYSHLVEYGTGPDTKQGSTFGPDTPTPEFAVMARTAAAFGGTSDGEDGKPGDGD